MARRMPNLGGGSPDEALEAFGRSSDDVGTIGYDCGDIIGSSVREVVNGNGHMGSGAADACNTSIVGKNMQYQSSFIQSSNHSRSITAEEGENGHDNTSYAVNVNSTALPRYASKAYQHTIKISKQRKTASTSSICNNARILAKTRQTQNEAFMCIMTASNANIDVSDKNADQTRQNAIHNLKDTTSIPSSFPAYLTLRALSTYATLRSLSLPLRVSPFTPIAFLRALSLQMPNPLLGAIHVKILQVLYANHGLGKVQMRGDGRSSVKLPFVGSDRKREDMVVNEYLMRMKDMDVNGGGGNDDKDAQGNGENGMVENGPPDDGGDDIDTGRGLFKGGGENLIYLNRYTWPLYFMDFVRFHRYSNRIYDAAGQEKETISGVEAGNGGGEGESDEWIHTEEMERLFKYRRPANEVPLEFCEPPYKNFEWMKDMPVAEVEEENKDVPDIKGKNGRSRKSRKSNIGRNSRSRRKRRRRNGGDSSEEDDDYVESDNDNDLEGGSRNITNTGNGASSKRKRFRNDIVSTIPSKVVQPKFCESERSPRPVTKNVYDTIQNFINSFKNADEHSRGICDHIQKTGANVEASTYDADEEKKEEKESVPSSWNEEERNKTKNLDRSSFQLDAANLMEKGTPYYDLSAEMKLSILEFLVDELMNVEYFQIALQSRMEATTAEGQKLYEPQPTEQELESVVNEDKCTLCGLEGDLLCCDGCCGSFHKKCVQLSPYQEFAEKWLCRECEVVDSSKLGSLYGGLKCSLDWFTLNNLDCQVAALDRAEFLVIHGFVFVRHSITKARVDVVELLSSPVQMPKECLSAAKISAADLKMTRNIKPLDSSELFSLLQHLGPDICERWPFTQIPFDSRAIWSECPSRCQRSAVVMKFYSAIPSAVNPFVYDNKYKQAPPLPFVSSHIGKANVALLQKDSLPIINPEKCLEFLSRNTSNDSTISQLIQCNKTDPSTMHSAREFMLDLERSLFRSSLLHELWGLRNKDCELHWWRNCVSACCSFRVLAKLLVYMIDETHSRAFRDEWNLHPGVASEDFTLFEKESRTYVDLPVEWGRDKEMRKRNWERCLASDVLGLLAKESKSKIKKSCRKKKVRGNEVNFVPVVKKKEVNSSISTENIEGSKSRRRSREGLTRNGVKGNYTKPVKYLGEDAEAIRDAVLGRLEGGVGGDFEGEGHWPVAGRKLFAPSGSLPASSVKWLGRNAGGKKAPGVFYTDKFEIGLPSVQMIWRQKTLSCKTFSELIYALEFLNSYFDKSSLLSCEKLSARAGLKEHIQKTVMCSRYDQELGTVEHFVVHKNKWRGCWQSSASVDSSAFIVFRSCRIKGARQKNKQCQLHGLKRLLQNDQPENESRIKSDQEPSIGEKKNTKGALLQVLKKNIDKTAGPILSQYLQKVEKLLGDAVEQGLCAVPQHISIPMRAQYLETMRKVYQSYGSIGLELFSRTIISELLAQAEEVARKKFKKEIDRLNDISRARIEERQRKASAPPYTHHKISRGKDAWADTKRLSTEHVGTTQRNNIERQFNQETEFEVHTLPDHKSGMHIPQANNFVSSSESCFGGKASAKGHGGSSRNLINNVASAGGHNRSTRDARKNMASARGHSRSTYDAMKNNAVRMASSQYNTRIAHNVQAPVSTDRFQDYVSNADKLNSNYHMDAVGNKYGAVSYGRNGQSGLQGNGHQSTLPQRNVHLSGSYGQQPKSNQESAFTSTSQSYQIKERQKPAPPSYSAPFERTRQGYSSMGMQQSTIDASSRTSNFHGDDLRRTSGHEHDVLNSHGMQSQQLSQYSSNSNYGIVNSSQQQSNHRSFQTFNNHAQHNFNSMNRHGDHTLSSQLLMDSSGGYPSQLQHTGNGYMSTQSTNPSFTQYESNAHQMSQFQRQLNQYQSVPNQQQYYQDYHFNQSYPSSHPRHYPRGR